MTRFGERALVLSGFAARMLGWRPGEFWEATPAELASAVNEAGDVEPVETGELKALMARFPDQE